VTSSKLSNKTQKTEAVRHDVNRRETTEVHDDRTSSQPNSYNTTEEFNMY